MNLAQFKYNNLVEDVNGSHLYTVIGGTSNNSTDFIYGKKITDIAPLIKKNLWTANTKYGSFYDNTGYDYFVINQYNAVYKVLYNANTNSTIEPNNPSTSQFQTADGYIWKYMYSISSQDYNKFLVSDRIPIVSNTAIEAAAVPGKIDRIVITNGGNNFSVYKEGTIQAVVSNTIFKIDTAASSVTNYYKNSAFYAVSGSGAGSLAVINTSYSNSIGKYIQFSNSFAFDVNTQYIIGPQITLTDRAGSGFLAYSTVSNQSIASINILNGGSGYINPSLVITTQANTGSNVSATIVYSNTGHGKNPFVELNSNSCVLYSRFINDEAVTVPKNLLYYNTSLLSVANTTQNSISYGIAMTCTANVQVGSLVRGLTSNASGYCYYNSNSTIMLNQVIGSFSSGETITDGAGNSNSMIILKQNDETTAQKTVLYGINIQNGFQRSNNIFEESRWYFDLGNN